MKVKETDKMIALVIAGVSGSGKSSIVTNLITEYPDLFHKLPQVSTRDPRFEGEDSYLFLGEMGYESIKKGLIGRLNNFYGANYGTIPDFRPDKLNILILAKDALDELKLLNSKDNLNLDIFTIGIDKDLDYVEKRQGREIDKVDKEKLVLLDSDVILTATDTRFITNDDVINALKNSGYIIE